MASTVQSRKAKGRRLQQYIRDWIVEWVNKRADNPMEHCSRTIPYKITEDDVKSTSMGASGSDVTLSPRAQDAFGRYSIECKNQEGFKKVYDAYKQAGSGKKAGTTPVVFIKSNREPVLVIIGLDDWTP